MKLFKHSGTLTSLLYLSLQPAAYGIYYGTPAARGEAPYVAKLGFTESSGYKNYCSGVMVRNRWALASRWPCIDQRPLSALRLSVWGPDAGAPLHRTVRAAFHRSLPRVTFHHRLTKIDLSPHPDDLVYLLLDEPVGSDNTAPLSFEPINDTELAYNNEYLQMIGTGRVSGYNPASPVPHSVYVPFHTYRFTSNAAPWFILTANEYAGAGSPWADGRSSDAGGAAMFTKADGETDLVGIILGYQLYFPAEMFAYTIRLSAHRDEAISIMGWSDDEPWRWEPSSSEIPPPPTSFRYHGSQPDTFLCRDLKGQSGVLITDNTTSPPQRACYVLNELCRYEMNSEYEVLTGSLHEYFTWNNRILTKEDSYFTAQTSVADVNPDLSGTGSDYFYDSGSASGSSSSIPLQASPYCMLGTELGILHHVMCFLVSGTGSSNYKALVPYSVLDNDSGPVFYTERVPTSEPSASSEPVSSEPVSPEPVSPMTGMVISSSQALPASSQPVAATTPTPEAEAETAKHDSARMSGPHSMASILALVTAWLMVR